MDFAYSDEQRSVLDLAKQILSDGATAERMTALEKSDGPRFDPQLWKELATAGLLGIAIPEEHGGAGLGFLEVAGIIEQAGRTTAPVPLLETLVLGALPIAAFGDAEQKKRWLPRIAGGDAVVTAALVEPEGELEHPTTRAVAQGNGWVLRGTKICVPAAQVADCVLIPAATGENRVGVFLVETGVDGMRIDPLDATSGQPEARVALEDVRVEAGSQLGGDGDGGDIVAWIRERATAALASLALGVCDEALRITAEYTKTRKQFDQPIAMFQAVGQRAADAYIDTEGIRLTALQAAWRIAEGLPAAQQVAVAKIWAADAGQRVVHTAQHLHGGIGVDRDYPLHRYFLYAKQLELTLGGATQQLRRLGKMLAEEVA
jgi:alkylation response protein AidB-like acyl-CoA dehydrogenase